MKKNIILLSLILLSLTQFSAFPAEQLNADAVYSFIKYEYSFNEDGSIVLNYEHGLKLLTNYAVSHAFGESFVTYNPAWQTLKVTKSKTKMADGSEVNSPFNAFNEVQPGSVNSAAPYMGLREMVITHTGLEKNAEINFGYSLSSKSGYLPGFLGKIIIGGHEPVKNLDIFIKVPKDKKLNLYMSNSGPIGDKYTKDNYDYYIWQLKDIPMVPREQGQPTLEEFLPTLYFSTLSNSDVANHIISNEAELLKLSEKTKSVINNILTDKFTFQDKAFALKDYVFSNIAETNINPEYLAYKPLKAQETFDRNVGSYLDRAVLLTAFCREAGLDADLALASSYTNAKPDLSLLSEFGNYLVYCKSSNVDDNPLLLDPNHSQNNILPASARNKPVFVINTKKLYLIPAVMETGKISFNANFKLNADTLEGNAKLILSGFYLPALESENCKNTVRNFYVHNGWTAEDNKSGILVSENNNFSDNLQLKMHGLKKIDDLTVINLPDAPNSLLQSSDYLIPASRITPVKLSGQFNEEYNFTIELPADSKLAVKPESLNISNSQGTVLCSIEQKGNKITAKRKISINQIFTGPENYHYLYELYSAWRNKAYRTLYVN